MDYYEQARKDIVDVVRKMYETKLVNAYEGNVSIRVEDRIFITPGSVNKGVVTEDMILEVDIDGDLLVPSEYKPSSESKLHYAIYKKRPGVKAVVHNHSIFATSYAVARIPIDTKSVPEMVVLFGTIPVFSYGTPGTPEVYMDLDKYSDETDVFLLANHGLVAVADDAWSAYEKAAAVEKTAQILIMSNMIGGEHKIEDEKLEELYVMRRTMLNNRNVRGFIV